MAPEVADVSEKVTAVTHTQRADLTDHVLPALDEPPKDPAAVEAAWCAEIGHRIDDYFSGNRDVISVGVSHAEIRADLTANRR